MLSHTESLWTMAQSPGGNVSLQDALAVISQAVQQQRQASTPPNVPDQQPSTSAASSR